MSKRPTVAASWPLSSALCCVVDVADAGAGADDVLLLARILVAWLLACVVVTWHRSRASRFVIFPAISCLLSVTGWKGRRSGATVTKGNGKDRSLFAFGAHIEGPVTTRTKTMATGPSSAPTSASGPAPSGKSAISQYFLLVLFVFGVLMFGVNLQQDAMLGHQSEHIEAFQAKHMIKSHSSARKKYHDVVGEEHEDPDEAEVETDEESPQEVEHELTGLKCDDFGGPSEAIASEMVYWEDIPSDNTFVSPFHNKEETQYITFEADHGGWNNIRVSAFWNKG